jgi:hypothetical protein
MTYRFFAPRYNGPVAQPGRHFSGKLFRPVARPPSSPEKGCKGSDCEQKRKSFFNLANWYPGWFYS